MSVAAAGSRRSQRALDGLNFFLADVRDGVGPFLAIWLTATHKWDAGSIGVVMAAMPIAGVIAQAPAGLLVDASIRKRALVVGAALVVAVACVAMTFVPRLGFLVAAQALTGMAAALLVPATVALSLGVAGRAHFTRRMGRNEGFNHAGNVVAAIAAGLLGHFVGREWIFYLVAVFAVLSAACTLAIRPGDIDDAVARGGEPTTDATAAMAPGGAAHPDSIASVWTRPLLMFGAANFLFHFANAAMLPLVGQYLVVGVDKGASLFMSACIVVAQLVMIPMAGIAGRYADRVGRKPLLLVAFAALPVRGVLYTVSDDPAWLIAVQALDGIGAGLLGVLFALVVSDLTRGSGRFNFAMGALSAAVGVGAFMSAITSGFVVEALGFSAGFLFLSAIAALAFVLLWLAVPETLRREDMELAAPR